MSRSGGQQYYFVQDERGSFLHSISLDMRTSHDAETPAAGGTDLLPSYQ